MRAIFKLIKWLIIIAIVVVIAIGAAGYYFISTFDLNKYKTQVSELVEQHTGRKLTINGEAHLGISWNPSIIVEDVTLSNAEWADDPFMVKVDRLEVQVEILPLIRKQIVIEKIILKTPYINLEINKDGVPNWQFVQKGVQVADNSNNVPVKVQDANEAMEMLKDLRANKVSISDGVVVYKDARSKKVNKLEIVSLEMSVDDVIKLDFAGAVDGNQVKAVFKGGSLDNLMSGKTYPIDLSAKAYGATVNLAGKLEKIMSDPMFDLDVSLINPKDNMGAPETNFKGHVVGGMKSVKVNIASLEVAKNVITGDVSADISDKLPFVIANLKSDLINLQNFQEKQSVSLDLISSANASALVPETKIPYEFMNMANAKAVLDIKKLVIDEAMTADNVSLKAQLQNGVLDINPLVLDFGGGNINVVSNVNAAAKTIALKANANKLSIQKLHKEFVVTDDKDFGISTGGDIDLDINVKMSGDNARQLVNNLNGRSIVIVGQSKVHTGKMQFMDLKLIKKVLDITQISKIASRDIDMNCAVVRTDFAGGKASFPNGIGMESKQVNVSSSGDINLVNDVIDFGVKPSLLGGMDANLAGALASFVRVQGTMLEPKAIVDTKNAAKTMVGIVANSPLGIVQTSAEASAPCYAALEGTAYESRFPKPIASPSSMSYKEAGKAVEKNIRDIRDSAKENLGTAKDDLKNLKDSAKDLLGAFKKPKKVAPTVEAPIEAGVE